MIQIAAALVLLFVQDDPVKEFEKRITVEQLKVEGEAFHRVWLDGKLLHRGPGDAPEFKVVEKDGVRFLKAVRDGHESLRVQLGDLGKDCVLPPVVVDDPTKAVMSNRSRVDKGEATCEATINGKTVYKGPGTKVESKVSASTESKDGKTTTRFYAEVHVDGKLVYKAGEALPDPDPKRNEDDRFHGPA